MPLSLRISASGSQGRANSQSPPQRRNSSGNSYKTNKSNPKQWFNHANLNPTATVDGNDTDPPFFQWESSSSSEDMPAYRPEFHRKLSATHSSAGDYRNIIDDQAIEIRKLKRELRQYKQEGPSLMQKHKLFEFKVYGLSKEGRRELESILAEFTSAVDGYPGTSASQHRTGSIERIGPGSNLSVDCSQRSTEATNTHSSNKPLSSFGTRVSALTDDVHYKPLFVQQATRFGQSTATDSPLSFTASDAGDCQQDLDSGGSLNERNNRHRGGIIYYNNAPFYTDLSRDPGGPPAELDRRLSLQSSSEMSSRPLSDMIHQINPRSTIDADSDDELIELISASTEDLRGSDMELPDSGNCTTVDERPLEPCGLGGVWPDDHFIICVATKRSNQTSQPSYPSFQKALPSKRRGDIECRLAIELARSALPMAGQTRHAPSAVEIEYLSGIVNRMAPVSLPPPVKFVSQFSTELSGSNSDSEDEGLYSFVQDRF